MATAKPKFGSPEFRKLHGLPVKGSGKKTTAKKTGAKKGKK